MSGYYSDGCSQADFDRAWNDLGNVDEIRDDLPLDEPIDCLFDADDCFEIGHIVPGGIE